MSREPHPCEYIEPETLYDDPFKRGPYDAPIDGELGDPGDDVDDGGDR